MDETELPLSMTLLVGRHIFDGASPERVAEMQSVSLDAVNRAWFECRERLSRHFAQVEGHEYTLLSDNELQARLHQTLLLLLEWRERELQAERFAAVKENETNAHGSKPNDEPPLDEETI